MEMNTGKGDEHRELKLPTNIQTHNSSREVNEVSQEPKEE